MVNTPNNSPENNNSIENNDKGTLTRIAEATKTKTTAALWALALATTLNFSSPAQAAESNIPEWAVAVEIVKDAKLTDIPFGARKVNFRDSEIFVWKNDDWTFSMQVTKMDQNAWTDDIHFEANVAWENYVFSIVGNDSLSQVLVAEQAPERQSQFGINYDRMTRGNSIIKNIMLSAESRLAEYFKETKWYNDSQISDELSWIARLFWRDTIDRITFEDFRAAYPEILTSLSYLDQNRFPNLYEIGLNQSAKEENSLIKEEGRLIKEEGERLDNIINKLTSNN